MTSRLRHAAGYYLFHVLPDSIVADSMVPTEHVLSHVTLPCISHKTFPHIRTNVARKQRGLRCVTGHGSVCKAVVSFTAHFNIIVPNTLHIPKKSFAVRGSTLKSLGISSLSHWRYNPCPQTVATACTPLCPDPLLYTPARNLA